MKKILITYAVTAIIIVFLLGAQSVKGLDEKPTKQDKLRTMATKVLGLEVADLSNISGNIDSYPNKKEIYFITLKTAGFRIKHNLCKRFSTNLEIIAEDEEPLYTDSLVRSQYIEKQDNIECVSNKHWVDFGRSNINEQIIAETLKTSKTWLLESQNSDFCEKYIKNTNVDCSQIIKAMSPLTANNLSSIVPDFKKTQEENDMIFTTYYSISDVSSLSITFIHGEGLPNIIKSEIANMHF